MTDPLARQAGYRVQAKVRELTDLMQAFTLEMSDKMTAADEAIANLNTVAATASSAINNSAVDRTAIHATLDAMTGRTLSVHSAATAVPALTPGGNTTVTITWPTPFPDTSYVCGDPVVSPSLLGKVTGTVTAQTTTGCTVRLSTTAAVSLGSSVEVTAVRYA